VFQGARIVYLDDSIEAFSQRREYEPRERVLEGEGEVCQAGTSIVCDPSIVFRGLVCILVL
jgi:hypothetical protein